MIIIGASALLVCLVFYMFFIKSRQSDLSDVKAEVETAESETSSLQAQLQQLQGLQENAPELEAELQRIRQFVPTDHEVPNFIFQVQEEADESGVDFVQISPELPKSPTEDPSGSTLAQVRVTIGASGGYFAVQDFMRRLYELDRALRIDTITITTGAEGAAAGGEPTAGSGSGTLTVAMTARIFFELPAGTVPGATGTETVPAPTETTPAPTETTPAPAGSPEATAPPEPAATEPPAEGEEETQ
jgi:Tfp pilus assembly protein PilO